MPATFAAIRGLFRALAESFALRDGDRELETFREMFEVIASNRYRLVGDDDRREGQRAVTQLAREAFDGSGDDAAGRRAFAWKPVAERYVVFSDHHILPNPCRQDFFTPTGNATIYAGALGKYYEKGYTLVENGDVEDLVVFEPTLERARERSKMSLEELNHDRKMVRRNQLRAILSESRHTPYLDQVRKFARDGRFVRVVGNHDYDIQREDLYGVWREILPDAQRPVDALFLHEGARPPAAGSAGPRPVRYVIAHGHQFDAACNPVSAPEIGEPTTECLGVYFEGPDRCWRAEHNDRRGRPAGSDGVHLYGTGVGTAGEEAMRNLLVTAEASDVNVAGLVARVAPALLAPTPAAAFAAAIALLATTPERDVRGMFEALFGHNIAWEYFRSEHAFRAVQDEVFGGARFFKYRHMDEVDIAQRWEQAFRRSGAPVPTLVLGHTHEARFQPHFRAADGGGPVPFYLNSGAAGRFAGMLWAIEIDAGTPRLVTWTMGQGSPTERSQAVHRVVDPVPTDGIHTLRTRTQIEAIP